MISAKLKLIFFLTLLVNFSYLLAEVVDLESNPQKFILEAKQIHIPGYPLAFNPSIIRWENRLLLSFRFIPGNKKSFDSELGLVWLDEKFNPVSKPQVLKTNVLNPLVNSRAEDGRLFSIDDQLYLIYSNNKEDKITRRGFRVFVSKLTFDGQDFHLGETECLSDFEGESSNLREKNWTPFSYNQELLLAYSQDPHVIFRPLWNGGECETFCKSFSKNDWQWGVLRGGTPAHLIEGEYLSFFHSSIEMTSIQSEGEKCLHYFMGAYTYEKEPPFKITKISPEPIVGKNFYNGPKYAYYWKPCQVVFPGGYTYDEKYIWVAFGKHDHEVWITKLDKKNLLNSLIYINEDNATQN